MYLKWLQVNQVRNLNEVKLYPCPQLNFLIGKNASGKTALLESIYLLSRARSFRTPRIREVIRYSSQSVQITAQLHDEKSGELNTGLKKSYGETTLRYNGRPVQTVSSQARNIPLVLLTPDTHTLVTGEPRQRRHWLDWALFHVERDYLEHWNAYMRAMRQRNVLLKKNIKNRELYVGWEQKMVTSGGCLSDLRATFLAELMEEIRILSGKIFSGEILFELSPGWPAAEEFAGVLQGCWNSDLRAGHAQFGPHRADLKITINNRKLSSFFSRGQIKLLTCLMMLSQARLLKRKTGIKPLVLIDDYQAELDPDSSKHLLSFLLEEQIQGFLTSTHGPVSKLDPERYKVFHVEQGQITEAAGKDQTETIYEEGI